MDHLILTFLDTQNAHYPPKTRTVGVVVEGIEVFFRYLEDDPASKERAQKAAQEFKQTGCPDVFGRHQNWFVGHLHSS